MAPLKAPFAWSYCSTVSTKRSGRSGGAGTATGIGFQDRLAAQLACAILAEEHAPPFWDWPEDQPLEAIQLETGEHVDDIRVLNAAGSSAHIQAKLRLNLSDSPTSDLGKTITAFADQYLDGLPDGNRLVLAVGPMSSSRIREDLPRLLERVRGLPPDRDLASIAKNKAEREVLAALRAHLGQAWRERTGADPSDAELCDMLRVVRVSVHDLGEDGAATHSAKGQLRTTVLFEPAQAGQVWGDLISMATSFAAQQSGADRQRLHALLAAKGVGLRAAPSYREDIERLKARSAATVAALEPLSRISPPGGERFKIERGVPAGVLAAVASGSILITGDPGAGKSASVFELITTLLVKGRDVFAIAADAMEIGGLAQLREELGLEHEVLDVLRNWPGKTGATLVIDGLDAARGEGTQQALLELIAATQVTASRWSVAASIRRFDLRYNHKLRDLFPAEPWPPVPAPYVAAEFAAVRHLSVPELTDAELAQLEDLAPALHELLASAPQDLRDLARVPFNLKLLAELVRLDVERSTLEPISTQVQLLDLYWEHRVIGTDGQGDTRSAVVGEIVEAMVGGRRLRAERQPLARPETLDSLDHLLSEGVLAELQSGSGTVVREVLVFSHHVLFDYAVERSLLRGTEERLSRAILERPDLLLFARQSFDLHFRHLWDVDGDRKRFWEACLALATVEGVPQIGRIVGPVVAAELIGTVEDSRPLLDGLRPGSEQRDGAEEILRHLVGAAVGSEPQPFWRGEAERAAWSAFAEALAQCELAPAIAFALRQVVSELAKDSGRLGDVELSQVGCAARVLLAHALDREVADRSMTWPAIEAVAATYASDPVASREQLGRILETERLTRFGYSEMPDLAHQVEVLIEVDPGFVCDIYVAAFSFEETSKEKTHMGGRVLSLSSHRSQDYASAHYSLARAYPEFLSAASVEAVQALIAVQAAYAQKHFPGSAFSLPWGEGREARILEDGSGIWDGEPLGHDDEVKILNAFEEHLASLAEEDPEAPVRIVDLLLECEVPASIWRRLIRVASGHPDVLEPLIRPLLLAPAALANEALAKPLAEFLRTGFSDLAPEVREEVERAILAIPDHFATANPDHVNAAESGAMRRNRLLVYLPLEALTEAEAKELLAQLREEKGVPEDLEPEMHVGWREAGDWRRGALAEQGVEVDSEPNRRIAELAEPIHEFAAEHLNGSPSAAQVKEIRPALEDLWKALGSAESDGADPRQADQGFGFAAEVAEAIARSEVRDRDDPALVLATEILFAAASQHNPVHDPTSDAAFDKHPHWGSPAPRVEAAKGLLTLAADLDLCTPELLGEIERLSRDPHPAVRLQVARGISLLRVSAPDLMWEIAERIAAEDSSRVVVQAFLCDLPSMTEEEPERRRQIAESLYSRTPSDRPGGSALRRTAVSLIVDLHVWDGDDAAGEFLRREVIANLADSEEGMRQAIVRLRNAQNYGVEGDANADAIRARALALIEYALRQALADFEELSARLQVPLQEGDPDLERARNAAEMIDTIAAELYFASGAHKGANADEPKVSRAQSERLYREAGSVFDLLADAPVPPATHYLLETLEACIEFDPRGVFIRISRAIEGGKAGGYQFDNMAADLFVSLIERYLAEYRTLLQGDEELLKRLIEMLDTFVEVGWPKARRLTYGLHELFR